MKTKSSNVLIILNSVSIFLAFIGLLAAKYMTSVDMATGIALFPLALIACAVWLWTYIADFDAIFKWLAKKLGFNVRKGFIVLLAILPLVAFILYDR
jgi:hypothetical protein